MAVLALVPLAYVVSYVVAIGPVELWELVARPRIAELLRNTITLAVACMAATAALGVALAVAVERTDLPGRRLWHGLLVAPLAVPAFVNGYAWVSLDRGVQGSLAASRHDDPRSGRREGLRHRRPDAATTTGDEGDEPIEAETIVLGHGTPCRAGRASDRLSRRRRRAVNARRGRAGRYPWRPCISHAPGSTSTSMPSPTTRGSCVEPSPPGPVWV